MKDSKSKNTVWGIIGAAVLLAIGKMKWFLPLLKFLKLKTLISMAVYLATYAFFLWLEVCGGACLFNFCP